MPRHKLKTIKEKGGLKVHVHELGYNYSLLVLLIRAKVPNTIVANVLGLDKNNKPAASTIKHWKETYRAEQATKREAADKVVDEL